MGAHQVENCSQIRSASRKIATENEKGERETVRIWSWEGSASSLAQFYVGQPRNFLSPKA
jgi:hypothetical protein